MYFLISLFIQSIFFLLCVALGHDFYAPVGSDFYRAICDFVELDGSCGSCAIYFIVVALFFLLSVNLYFVGFSCPFLFLAFSFCQILWSFLTLLVCFDQAWCHFYLDVVVDCVMAFVFIFNYLSFFNIYWVLFFSFRLFARIVFGFSFRSLFLALVGVVRAVIPMVIPFFLLFFSFRVLFFVDEDDLFLSFIVLWRRCCLCCGFSGPVGFVNFDVGGNGCFFMIILPLVFDYYNSEIPIDDPLSVPPLSWVELNSSYRYALENTPGSLLYLPDGVRPALPLSKLILTDICPILDSDPYIRWNVKDWNAGNFYWYEDPSSLGTLDDVIREGISVHHATLHSIQMYKFHSGIESSASYLIDSLLSSSFEGPEFESLTSSLLLSNSFHTSQVAHWFLRLSDSPVSWMVSIGLI